MEPIVFCGAVILIFGLWIELEQKITLVARQICNSRFVTAIVSQFLSATQEPYSGGKSDSSFNRSIKIKLQY
jgi:hypothetical protein